MVVFMIGLGRPFLSKRGVILCACRREGSPVQRATVLVHYSHRIMLVEHREGNGVSIFSHR